MFTTEYLLDWVRDHPLTDKRIIPICLWGESGTGKTTWINGYCQQRDFGFRVYYPAHDLTGADIVGQAHIDEATDRTVHARPTWLPSADDAVVFQEAGVIFIDEINRAQKQVLRGLMEPLGEGRIANSGWALPSKWSFVCAANPPNSTYDVDVLDEALMNRLLHVPMGFDVVRWSAWAGTKNVHQDLISFTAQHPGSVAAKNPELPEEIVVKATPRTIEYLARLYEPNMDRDLLRVLAQGLIGDETAAQFLRHIDNPERAVSDDEVLNDDGFEARIIAHLSAGRDDLLDASQTLLLAMMVRHHATPESAARVALYMQAIGGKRSTEVWETMVVIAPYWQEALTKAAGDLKTSKRNAAAAGRATR